jgi:glutathione-independent formaldehyde dehydrogenase
MVLDGLVKAVRTTGGIGVVGVYVPQDPQAATEGAKEGRIGFDCGTFFQKGQRIGTGQCPVKRYNTELRDLIIAGKAEARPAWKIPQRVAAEPARNAVPETALIAQLRRPSSAPAAPRIDSTWPA